MADVQAERRGGGLSKLILWLLVLGLLVAVWWLASERNLRRFAWRPSESVLTIAKGRFIPLGMANIAPDDPQLGKVYGPLPIPQGAKIFEQEFEDQTALDRALFDLVVPWARADAEKGDEKSIAEAGRLVDRASALPGLTAEQHQQLGGLRGELAFTAAKQELLQAAKLVLSARRKLQSVEEGERAAGQLHDHRGRGIDVAAGGGCRGHRAGARAAGLGEARASFPDHCGIARGAQARSELDVRLLRAAEAGTVARGQDAQIALREDHAMGIAGRDRHRAK